MWLLLHRSGKFYLVKDRATFNTEYGVVEVKEGFQRSTTGEEFLVTRPTFRDLWFKIKRGPQITHWKDLGLIAALTGVGAGWKILEIGGGSGFSTLFWSNIVGDKGKVVSYEKNPRHYKILLSNIESLRVQNVELHPDDPLEKGIEERNFDMAFLDIPEPWKLVDIVADVLKPGGFLVSYLPTIEQVKRLEESLKERFTMPEVHEVIHREWKLGGRTRPLSSGILHTAFIVLSRKIK